MQAGHHWEVAALGGRDSRNILSSANDYGALLEQDMAYRREQHPGQLERILEVMAESEGGRAILTGNDRDSGIFETALSKVLGADEAKTLIADVEKRIIEPYENLPKAEATLRSSLRRRGHYI